MTDPREFWEGKIDGWETGRYDRKASGRPLEAIADAASSSLRFRLKSAGELLAPLVQGKRVADLGCGTGRLGAALIAAGATSYLGVDIAQAAIDGAKERSAAEGWADRATFLVGGVRDLPQLDVDLVVSLGLVDWLTDEELSVMFARSGKADFLHAIGEKRFSPAQWAHILYTRVAYGWWNGGYVPRYFSADHLPRLASPTRSGPFRVWRHPGLSFGAYITTLPIGEAIPLL